MARWRHQHPGSWWPAWADWRTQFGGGKVKARVPGKGELRARGEIMGGLARTRAGDAAAGHTLLRHGMAGVVATGTLFGQAYDHAVLAEALLATGDPAGAREAAEKGAAIAYRTGEHFYTPPLLTVGALAAHALGEVEQAERELRRAVAEAGERQMRLFELRAASHLSRLWADAGERRKALDLLAPVYEDFPDHSTGNPPHLGAPTA